MTKGALNPKSKAVLESYVDRFTLKNSLDVDAIIFMMKLFANDNFRKAVRYLEGDPTKLKGIKKYLKARGASNVATELYRVLSRESYTDAAAIWWHGGFSTQKGMEVIINSLVQKMKDQIDGFDDIFNLGLVRDHKHKDVLPALLRKRKSDSPLFGEGLNQALKSELVNSVALSEDDLGQLIRAFKDNQETIMRAFQLPEDKFDANLTKTTFKRVKRKLKSKELEDLVNDLIRSNLVNANSSAKFTPKNYADLVAFLTASTLAGILAALVKFLEPNFAKWPMGLNIATGIATVLVLFILPMVIRKITTAVVKWHYNRQVSYYTSQLEADVPAYAGLFKACPPIEQSEDTHPVHEAAECAA